MGFASDNGKGLTVTPASGTILSGGKSLSSLTLGQGNYEYVELQSDGNAYRIVSATRNTLAGNGLQSREWPGNWLFPAGGGYAAATADNGNVLSSYNTSAGLTVTLPATSGLPSGWSVGLATDNGKPLTVQVNGSGGGQILYPMPNAAPQSSLTLAGNSYEFVVLQYDGSGSFRLEHATPATAQQLGLAGLGGVTRWRFPAASGYAAAVSDNGTALSAANSPASYLTVTLPATSAINAGWTIAIGNENGKTAAVQVNGTSGGKILYPGSGSGVTSLQLASGDYETAVLQFDGGNFRVMHLTPASAGSVGMTGGTCTAKWSFPAVATYAAGATDCGMSLSNFNAPGSGLTVTLPPTTAITAGWSMGFVSDNNKNLTVQANGTSGGHILLPGSRGAQTAVTLYGQNYEALQVQFDGSNFRVVSASPATASANGMFPATGTPASSSAACQIGQLEFDSNYLYACTASNTWKRSAWSSF
jgi:invasion protein IalB